MLLGLGFAPLGFARLSLPCCPQKLWPEVLAKYDFIRCAWCLASVPQLDAHSVTGKVNAFTSQFAACATGKCVQVMIAVCMHVSRCTVCAAGGDAPTCDCPACAARRLDNMFRALAALLPECALLASSPDCCCSVTRHLFVAARSSCKRSPCQFL